MNDAQPDPRHAGAGHRAERLHAVILAGGSGTRLWPLSRRQRPKQLLRLFGQDSMLRVTADRLAGMVPPERTWVLTNAEYVAEVRSQLPEVPAEQIVGEPVALGNAAAVGLGVALVASRDPGATMAVLTADHVIRPMAAFQASLAKAVGAAASGRLVTFGIKPTRPDTGLGYVEIGAPLQPGAEVEGAGCGEDGAGGKGGEDGAGGEDDAGDAGGEGGAGGKGGEGGEDDAGGEDGAGAVEVLRFVEKPDQATAERYVESGRFLWNSGMFVWRVDAIRRAYTQHLPGTSAVLEAMCTALGAGRCVGDVLAEHWASIPDRTTIDYGIMEREPSVACVPADFEWRDVGSWDALANLLDPDAQGNRTAGDNALVDVRDSLIMSRGDRMVTAIGLREVAVIDTGDALFVCPLERAHEVREIVSKLREVGRDDLL